jgi:hypothetical protein
MIRLPHAVLTESDVTKIIQSRTDSDGKKIPDKVMELYGPTVIGDIHLWEIWIETPDDICIRFLEELDHEAGKPSYQIYETFQSLAVRLSTVINLNRDLREARQWTESRSAIESQNAALLKMIGMGIGGLGFLIVIAVFAYAIISEKSSAYIAGITLAGVVSSACVLFYGRFVPASATSKQSGK